MAKEKGKSKPPNWPSKEEGKKSGGGRENAPQKPKSSSNLPKSKGEKKA